eukprot:3463082-Alexandrium_andersonii.AAC.1
MGRGRSASSAGRAPGARGRGSGANARGRAPAGSGALSSEAAGASCPGPMCAEEFGIWDKFYAQMFRPYYTRIFDITKHG